MKKAIVALSLALLLGGCGHTVWDMDRNRDNLNKLEIGMTKAQVIEIMGKPRMREATEETEWLLYWTGYGTTDRNGLTPIAFRDSKVIGWGRNFWETREQKYDIKLEHTIKRED